MKLYFEIFHFTVPAYGTMALAGVAAALLAAFVLAGKSRILPADILGCAGYGGLGLVIGAKLFYAIPLLPEYLSSGGQMSLRTLFAGYVFYGGFLGMVCGVSFYAHMMRRNVFLYWDLLAAVTPLFHGFGRLGCFFAGCCYGREYHGIFAVRFPQNPYESGIELVPRFPVQLAESLCNFLLFVFLLWYGRKKRRPGRMMGMYLVTYPVIRFFMELLRGDAVRGVYRIAGITISTSQIISIVLFAAGCVLIRQTILENDIGNEKTEKKFQKKKR